MSYQIKYFVFILLLGLPLHIFSQENNKYDLKVYCERIDSNINVRLLPERILKNKSLSVLNENITITPTYIGLDKSAELAVDYALNLWTTYIKSKVAIKVLITPANEGDNILASAYPTGIYTNFDGSDPNIQYPVALAEKISGKQLNHPDSFDIKIRISNDTDIWYYGTDGNTPNNKYDLVTVIMHEFAHGLGFTGSFRIDHTDQGSWGFTKNIPLPFDINVVNGNNQFLIDETIFGNPSSQLKDQIVSKNLFFESEIVKRTKPDENIPKLYAPSDYSQGSSIYHLDDEIYLPGNENSLMTAKTGFAEAIHIPGPLTIDILHEMGWAYTNIVHKEHKDVEIIDQPLSFTAQFNSDNPPEYDENYLFYRTDSLSFDSIKMTAISGDEVYYAEYLLNDTGTVFEYYIKSLDDNSKAFFAPKDAPNNVFRVRAGFDHILPEIIHEPIKYVIYNQDSVLVTAKITDNLGVDTAFVFYNVNFSEDTFKIGLKYDSLDIYTGYIRLDDINIQVNDIIEYRFEVIDKSILKNKLSYVTDKLIFPIEENDDIKYNYSQDFNSFTTDFYGVKRQLNPFTDINFHVSVPGGFNDGCLHTPNPYKSTGIPLRSYEYIAQLRFPVRLSSSSILLYDEVVLVEPGNDGREFGDPEFWDYTIVEASKDKGNTWYPLAPGYKKRKNFNWLSTYRSGYDNEDNSTGIARPDMFITNNINILENPNFNSGDTLYFRFRLFSDTYANGWGWAIDNINIQGTVGVPTPFSNLVYSNVYPNPAREFINVDLELAKPVTYYQITLHDLTGRVVKSINSFQGGLKISQEIYIENLPKGVYFLKISSTNISETHKFVKK